MSVDEVHADVTRFPIVVGETAARQKIVQRCAAREQDGHQLAVSRRGKSTIQEQVGRTQILESTDDGVPDIGMTHTFCARRTSVVSYLNETAPTGSSTATNRRYPVSVADSWHVRAHADTVRAGWNVECVDELRLIRPAEKVGLRSTPIGPPITVHARIDRPHIALIA